MSKSEFLAIFHILYDMIVLMFRKQKILFVTKHLQKSQVQVQDLPPPSRNCVYACVYAYTRPDFFLLFLIFSVEEGATRQTSKKFTVFTGKIKVGPKCPIFIRGDPYEPHKPTEKVTFSYYQLGWFQVSESHKSFCLASISVRYEVPTQFWKSI